MLGLIAVHNSLFSQQQVCQSSCWVKYLPCSRAPLVPRYCLPPQLRSVGSKVLKRLYRRNHGKLQPEIWPSIMPCCIQACIYTTSTNRSQGRASAFPFSAIRNASSENKRYDKPGVCSKQSNWCHFQPPPFLQISVAAPPQTLLLSCNQNTGTWGCQELPWPGTACIPHPVNRQKSLDSCVSQGEDKRGEGWVCPETASIRGLA